MLTFVLFVGAFGLGVSTACLAIMASIYYFELPRESLKQ